MNDDTDLDCATTNAAGELARLDERVRAMRSVLVRLLQDVVVAESELDNGRAQRLVQANEELVVAALRNQTEADTAARALDDMSRTLALDPLTQLPNRLLLSDRFTRAIASAKRRNEPLALLFLDLNNFKQINDTLGHGVGDQVLKFAARCLVSAVRDVDTVSRHGGDEFLILLSEVSKPGDAILVADKVIAALGAPTRFGEHVLAPWGQHRRGRLSARRRGRGDADRSRRQGHVRGQGTRARQLRRARGADSGHGGRGARARVDAAAVDSVRARAG